MNRTPLGVGAGIFFFGLLLMIPTLSAAQTFPTKPMNLMIGYAPGGGVDLVVRAAAAAAEKHLGHPFVLNNRGGGGGSTALSLIAKEKPDGYHLIGTASGGITHVPHLREVTYTYEDLAPIAIFAKASNTGLMVRGDSPFKTLKDLIDYARKNPGAVTFGVSGIGIAQHLIVEYIALKEGVKMTVVPYKGTAESFAAMLGGHITASSGGVQVSQDHIKTGRVRALVLYSEERMKALPDLPTAKNLGYDMNAEGFFFAAAPKGTPQPIVKRLEDAYRKGTDDPKYRETMAKIEMEVDFKTSEETKKIFESEYQSVGKLVQELKLPKEKETPEKR
jgi:tripartite-type tricarboxylate transporter receptor subunit TctC